MAINFLNTVAVDENVLFVDTVNDRVGIGTTSPVGKLYVGPTWNTSSNGNNLYIKSSGTTSSYDPQLNNTSDLGITMVRDSATTTGPDTVGLTLYNDDGTAGGFSPMLLFSKLETPTSQFKATMAGIYARSPLGTGNSGAWIDGELIFATAGAATQGIKQRMVINKEGLVGIGTTSPDGLLHVSSGTSGDALVIIESDTDNNDENDNPQLQFKQDGGNTIAKIGLSGDAGTIFTNSLTNTAYFGNDEAASVQLYTNATARLTIESGGDVGIGTTSPGSLLHIEGSKTTAVLQANQTGTGVIANFKQAGSSKVLIDNAGNVGIGVTSPGSKLDIVGSSLGIRVKKADLSDVLRVYTQGFGIFMDNGNVHISDDLKIGATLISNQENTDIDSAAAEVIAQVAISYTAAFFDFVVKKGTNVRSGTVYACHDGTNVEFTETSTNDLGDTSDVTLSVDKTSTNLRLIATVTSDDWSVKSLIRAI